MPNFALVRAPPTVEWRRRQFMTIPWSRKLWARNGIFRSFHRISGLNTPLKNRYVLISPCRNEAAFMRQTLDSVVGQSLRPAKWVIVDDGSTDETPAILTE